MLEILKLFVHSFWEVLGQMAPYLLFGYLIAGILSVFVTTDTVKTHLGGSKFGSILKAALFGMPLPLCSCSVIPVTASLHKSGAGRGAVASFLISTPTTGVDSIMAAWALMGPIFAIYRAIMSIILGVVAGVFVNILGDSEVKAAPASQSSCSSHSSGCENEAKSQDNRLYKALRYAFITLPKDLGKPLIVGILIASFISALIEGNFIDQFLGGGFGTMLIMLVLGVPLYVCATASIPLALGFMALGATPGAAFVFLIAGPATNAATITVLWKMIGKRSTIIMLACIFFGALGGGMALDAVWNGLGANIATHSMHLDQHTGWLYSLFAIIFIIIHMWATFRAKVIFYVSGGTKQVEDSCCSGEGNDETPCNHGVDVRSANEAGCCSSSEGVKAVDLCCSSSKSSKKTDVDSCLCSDTAEESCCGSSAKSKSVDASGGACSCCK